LSRRNVELRTAHAASIDTGKRTHNPRPISKRRNRYLRMLFVQAARAVLLRPQSWEKHGLKSWIEAAARRLNRFKLAIALANKIARIVWGVLHGGRNFEVRTFRPALQAA
jgi:transposase